MAETVAVSSFKQALEQFKQASLEAGASAAAHFRYAPNDANPLGWSPKEIYNDEDPTISLEQRKLYVMEMMGKLLHDTGKDVLEENKVLDDAQARTDKVFRSQSASFAALDKDHKALKAKMQGIPSEFELNFIEYAMARGFACPPELLDLIVRFLDEQVIGG